ncbi:hypothetical protein H310_07810 [Aphanomyces invadans]|uniref:Uncharacterized protein n=1 Tax=Aphanomyces invadans TaxID=157072 RepID=A0A024U2B3_9STRA|nr:hypothetical protein H310_07810 [Aphanomyces invadans]ETV99757.1 hypothetical protein H310_07810 [Aphanomyces invadans]|eukprot:XP_008871533.1 hypothetical protein H310_07810 [Aphanomyces invadans]
MSKAYHLDGFLADVGQIGYVPQGRYAKTGKLRPEDVETLMQGGALDGVWTWVQHNVKATDAIDLLRRNLHVASQAPTSPDILAHKQRRVAALAEKKRQLQSDIAKLQTDKKQLIAKISFAEQAMALATDPPIHALLHDTYALQAQYRHQEREGVMHELLTSLRPPSSAELSGRRVVQKTLHHLEHLLRHSRPPPGRQRWPRPSSPRQLMPPSLATHATVQEALQVPGQVLLDALLAWHADNTSAAANTRLPELTPYRPRRPLHDIESQIQRHMELLYVELAARQNACERLRQASPPITSTVSATPATARQLEFLQSYGESLAQELQAMDAAAATTAEHLAAIASFESRLDQCHKNVAAAFRTNRALVVDILDLQNKLLVYVQTELVDAFQGLREETEAALADAMKREVAKWSELAELPQQFELRRRRASTTKLNSALQRIETSVLKLEAAKAEFDGFLQTSPCFAVLSWEELLEQVREVDAVVSDAMLPDLGRLEEVAADLLDVKLPTLFRAIHSWFDQPAQHIVE